VIQLYAITDCPGPPLPDIASLRAIATRELVAVCAPVEDHEVTSEVLWRYEQVVEALMDDRDVLPVRYGTRVPDEAAAARVLEANYDQLAERLEFVRGAAELSVRVLVQGRPSPRKVRGRASSGSEYLRARARETTAEADAVRAVHAPLSAAARATSLRTPGLSGEILRAAYLVDHERVESYGRLMAELQDANSALRLTCTGPWPPYSFAQP
jgi:hypothetical protein